MTQTIFCFARHLNGSQYAFTIPCRDWAEAEKIARDNFWRLDGELVATIPAMAPNFMADLFVRFRNWIKGAAT